MDPRAGQSHKIMRQVLEIGGCDAAAAPRVHAAMRDAFYRRLLPSIEQACSALSTPGRVHRIGVLEIDLGEVPPDALESAVAEKFDRVFSDQLNGAMESAEVTSADLDAELYSYFLRTGTLPWWADRRDPRLLDTSVAALIERDLPGLRRAIESAPDRDMVWRRIALAHPDRLLDALVAALAPSLAPASRGLGAPWLILLEIVGRERGYPESAVRTLWWEELLRASGAGHAPAQDPTRFFGDVLQRLARRLSMDSGTVIDAVCRTLDRDDLSIPQALRDLVESLDQNLGRAESAAVWQEIADLLARRGQTDGLDPRVWDRVNLLIDRLPSRVRAETRERAARLRPFDRSIEPRRRPDLVRETDDDESAAMDLTFSDTDEIYVQNAGLVILWPFLEPFFAHLGLLTETKQISDPAARQRAVGLLQYLAAEDAAASEYHVPLNKALCGMPLDDVFDFGVSITEEEIEACTDLLTAVIQHAPILRDMSIGGFRRSFLLREGQLSIRDGHWLLRVQRETHDIVLDRFPWSASVVKLPWANAIMQVEW